MSRRNGPEVLVMGVGNLLWADEGFGVRAVETMARTFDVPDGVDLLEGGTQGLALIPEMADAKRILIFDAVDFDAEPGSLVIVSGEDVPRYVAGKKVSLHQTSMMEILALSDFIADGPPLDICLVGCQPEELEDYGGGLTATVAAQMEPALEAAVKQLAEWGFELVKREAEAGSDLVMPAAVARDLYESERPSAEDACRIGDDRFLTT